MTFCFGKPKKKCSSLNGWTIKRGGGVKGWPLRNFFLILLPLKNENYFTLDNLSKYGHNLLKFVGRYFHWVVIIFSKKYGYFSPKIVKVRFQLFKDQKT